MPRCFEPRTDILPAGAWWQGDRAEARDYQDIAELLRMGESLDAGLAAFEAMFGQNAAVPLRAIGYFGDVPSVAPTDRDVLTAARDAVRDLPPIELSRPSLAIAPGECGEVVSFLP